MGTVLSKPRLCVHDENEDSDSEGELRHQLRLRVRRFIKDYDQRVALRGELKRLERRRLKLIDYLKGQERVGHTLVPRRDTGAQTDVAWCASISTQTDEPTVRTSESQTSQTSRAEVQTQTKIKES